VFKSTHIYFQLAQSSFDVHLQEIVGTLVMGASVVLLRPEGNMDLNYLVKLLIEKNVSFLMSVPSFLNNVIDYLVQAHIPNFKYLTTFDLGGKILVIAIRVNLQYYYCR